MARLPTVGGDYGNWGTVLNEYLQVAHNADGTIDASRINETADAKIMTAAERTAVGSFRNVMTFAGVASAVDAGTDATSAIQAAIDACAPTSIPLFFPAGTYRVRNLLAKAGMRIFGAGQATVLKLLDSSSVGHHVIKCASDVSGVDNVYIGHLTVDGNEAQIGLSDLSMHGILCLGQHNNWTIEHVTARNTCGDGIAVSTPNGGQKPTNIRILNVHVTNTKRQDIGIVRAIGVTVADCSGDGRLDLEVNSGDGAALYGTTVTNCRFDEIYIVGRGAESGGFLKNNFAFSGLFAETRFHMWQTANAVVSGLVCGGEVAISECDRVTMDGVVCGNVYVYAPNNYTIRNCLFSNFQVSCATDNTPALRVSNAIDCVFSGFDIRNTATSGDGVLVSNATAQSAGTLSFTDFTVSHNRYGFYCIPTLVNGLTVRMDGWVVKNAGTRAIYVSTGPAVSYGSFIISQCDFASGITLTDYLAAELDQVKIRGDHTILIKDSAGTSIVLGDIEFIRATTGTSTIDLQNNTGLTNLVIGRVRQRASGGITVTLTGSTFAANVKAWIDGPVVEATTWASTLSDASIKEGSMYRLRGNVTNWGYTHNGTEWVAKAH